MFKYFCLINKFYESYILCFSMFFHNLRSHIIY